MNKLLVLLATFSVSAAAEIQPEPIGVIQTLPERYPPTWIIAQDASFFHMSDGKFLVVDAASDDSAGRFKGMFNGGAIAQFYQAKTKPEMYVAETFHSRGNRGERTDVLTIYDKRTLAPIDEVVLPTKRVSALPTHYYLQMVDNESIGLVYNFTPATSVTIVDMDAREVLGEIPVPGCALVYPMAGRAFASLCADGSMLSVQLDDDGGQASSARTEPFFDAETDPMMEKGVFLDGVVYFPSVKGQVYPVDLTGTTPKPGEPWSLLGEDDAEWRPGGFAPTAIDSNGRMYVLMHSDFYYGSHEDPGTEVWVFDLAARQRVDRIELELPAITIAVTRDENPLLVTTNVNLAVDVYDAKSGDHLRTMSDIGQETPLLLHGAN